MDARLRAAPQRKLPYALHNIFATIKILATQIQYKVEDYPEIANLKLEDLTIHYGFSITKESHTFSEWAAKRHEDRVVLDWLYMQNASKPAESQFLLHWAVACRKHTSFLRKRVIEDNYDPAEQHSSGMTALDIAVRCGDKDRLECLIDLLAENPRRQFALAKAFYVATQTGDAILAATLAKAGADLSYRDKAGNSALHIAIASGDTCISRIICNALPDIDINTTNAEGETATHMLARAKNEDLAVNLLSALRLSEQKEDLSLTNLQQQTPFTIAAMNGHERLIKLWMKESNDQNDPMQLSQWNLHVGLIAAAKSSYTNIVSMITPFVANRLPALAAAVQSKHDNAALAIIPFINITEQCQDKEGTALSHAAHAQRHDVVLRLCVTRLDKYIEERTMQKRLNNGAEHRHTFLGKGLGQPASRKIAAATTYREYLLGNVTDEALTGYAKELSSGNLGKLKVLVDKYAVNKHIPGAKHSLRNISNIFHDNRSRQAEKSTFSSQADAALSSAFYIQ